ncbi:MAG: OmpP1/FadL family transporter, partial [Pirellulaceae bacterium]
PVNRAMSGATAGAAVEAIGSMAWNPATIGGLKNELAFGFEALMAHYIVESSFPGVGSGVTADENGVIPIPNVAWVHQLKNPYMKFGVGLLSVGGYSVNMPADPTNPILTPSPALGGIGLGKVQGDVMYFQVPVSVSWQLSDKLVFAAGPTLTISKLSIDENAFVSPNANGLYPRGNGTRYHFGGGAQFGLYYVPDCCWSFGANLKTPAWIESLRYRSEDAAGLPRVDTIDVDLPLQAIFGLGYRASPHVLVTADVRYTDYENTDGWGDPAEFQQDFSVAGLGWRSVFSGHFGARLRLTEQLIGSFGYMYSDGVVEDDATFFNVGSDLGYGHGFSVGGTWRLNCCAAFNIAYAYFPEWNSTGPFVAPGIGAIPGSSITNRTDAHALTVGVNVNY